MRTWFRLLTKLRTIFTEIESRFITIDFKLEKFEQEMHDRDDVVGLRLDYHTDALTDAFREEHCKLMTRVQELEGIVRSRKLDRRKAQGKRRGSTASRRRRDVAV